MSASFNKHNRLKSEMTKYLNNLFELVHNKVKDIQTGVCEQYELEGYQGISMNPTNESVTCRTSAKFVSFLRQLNCYCGTAYDKGN